MVRLFSSSCMHPHGRRAYRFRSKANVATMCRTARVWSAPRKYHGSQWDHDQTRFGRSGPRDLRNIPPKRFQTSPLTVQREHETVLMWSIMVSKGVALEENLEGGVLEEPTEAMQPRHRHVVFEESFTEPVVPPPVTRMYIGDFWDPASIALGRRVAVADTCVLRST